MSMPSSLKKGYTTGVHAAIAFDKALEGFLCTGETTTVTTHKMDNDDLDVTKGCQIIVTLGKSEVQLPKNPMVHAPYRIGGLHLYAGCGVGIVTKDGLKPSKGYPAINPKPLEAISNAYYARTDGKIALFASIGVIDGEEIAKKTANAKVGVLGGISILGTTGWVKPVSSHAYLDAIRTEITFAKANGFTHIILTLGNSAYAFAQEHYADTQIIEIGNFVYDAIAIAQEEGIHEVSFVCGIGKAVKVMQGHKNTHNRFGTIDFHILKEDISSKLGIHVDTDTTKTVKGITQQLGSHKDAFYSYIRQACDIEIKRWFETINIHTIIIR
jgi:cobalt-precorrin-5B (C1)-methyltransferase